MLCNTSSHPYHFLSLQAYVEAENKYGIGDYSVRVVFRTAKANAVQAVGAFETGEGHLNKTNCCIAAGVQAQCEYKNLPL